jgi:membrane protein required for colicin V production
MGFLDIILGVLLAIALFKGIKMAFCRISVTGFFITLGIYAAVKFSNLKMFLAGFVKWNPNTIKS